MTPTGPPPSTPPSSAIPRYDLGIDPSIASLSDDRLTVLSASLTELIARRIEGINYAENRRAQIATLAGAVAAIGLAILPLGISAESLPTKAAFIAFSASVLVLAVAVWVVYSIQTNYDYPFTSQLTTWKWFYHQALPDKSAFGPGVLHIRGARRRQEEQTAYRDQWTVFTGQVAGISDRRINATQDLKQLYQLHVNERYKNLFLSRLRKLLTTGLAVAGIITLLSFAVAATVSENEPTASEFIDSTLSTVSSWSETGFVRTSGLSSRDIEYRLSATITNHNGNPSLSHALTAVDASGQPIPAEFSVAPGGATAIAPNTSLQVNGHFWIAAEDRGRLAKIYAR